MKLAGVAVLGSVALAISASALPGFADTVCLKNGQVIEGKVYDRGGYVIIEQALGGVRVDRAEIATIELDDPGAGSAGAAAGQDLVILLSGEELAGKVEVRAEGREVVIVREHGEVALDQRQVKKILWSHEAEEAQRAGVASGTVGEAVERILDRLADAETDEERARAREELHAIGIFGLPYLEHRAAHAKSPNVKGLIDEVIAVAKVRTLVTPAMAERLPNLARRVASPDAAVRLAALQEVAVSAPRDCPPLLVHVLERESEKNIRAFLIGQLARLNRSAELLEILEKTRDGGLRFATAVALGDNGIYVGVPLLIEGLKIDDLEVRRLAVKKLETYTGQFLGYFPEDPPQKRAEAVARWEEWWRAEGKAFVESSLRSTIRKGDVTEADKEEGREYWRVGLEIWDRVAFERRLEGEARRSELEKAHFYFRKSLERYPHFVNARLSLAILCYTELDRADEARTELDIVLTRYAEDGGSLTRQLANYHLGRIAHLERRWSEAEKRYALAAAIDSRFFEAQIGLGGLLFDRAVSPDDALALERRKELLEEALDHFTAALAAADAYEAELRDSARTAPQLDELKPFSAGPFLKTTEAMKAAVKRSAAEIHYRTGRTLAALKRDPEALVAYENALKLDPENPLYQGAVKAWTPAQPSGR